MKKNILLLSIVASTLTQTSYIQAQNLLNFTQSKVAKDKKLEVFPVKYTDKYVSPEMKEKLAYRGKRLIQIGGSQFFTEEFAFKSKLQKSIGIEVILNERDAQSLAKTTKKYQNQNLAIVLNGKVVKVVNGRKLKGGQGYVVSIQDKSVFDKIVEDLNS